MSIGDKKIFGYRIKDMLNPKRWKMAVRSEISEGLSYIEEKDAFAFGEMISYRKSLCPQCVNAGKCIGNPHSNYEGCGCVASALMSAPEADCPGGGWGALDPDNLTESWEKYKKTYSIKVQVS